MTAFRYLCPKVSTTEKNSIWYWRVCSSWLQCAAHHRYHSAPLIPCLFPRDEYSRTNEILSHSFNLYCWDLSPPYPTYLSLKSVGVFSSHRWYLIPLLGMAREIAQKLPLCSKKELYLWNMFSVFKIPSLDTKVKMIGTDFETVIPF